MTLSERVEALEGADRGVFMEASRHILGDENPRVWDAGDGRVESNSRWKFFRFVETGAWTDAALTLLPEGAEWSLSVTRDEAEASVWIAPDEDDYHGSTIEAATPCLALLAAILKARGL